MQHSSGLYKKIANLNNPEEIKKWREERKKRYPTKINIEKKAAEMKEKIDRGEKMGLNQKRRHNQFDRGWYLYFFVINIEVNLCKYNEKKIKIFFVSANGQHKKQNQNKDENNQQNRLKQYGKLGKPSINKIRKPKLPRKVHTVIPSTDSIGKLKPFAGIQDIVMENTTEDTMEETNCKFIIEDEDCDGLPIMNEEAATESKPIVCGALSSLMYDYDSSEDDMGKSDIAKLNEINEPKENNVALQINSNSITVIENIENKQSGAKSDDDGPEEMKIQKHAETNSNEEPLKVAEPRNNKKKIFTDKKPIKNQYTKPKYKVPSTLLQRLLRREVQQERNIVLQCVRHIVKNNFFDKS